MKCLYPFLAFLVSILCLPLSAEQSPTSTNTVLDKDIAKILDAHIEALGGRKALARVKSVVQTGQHTINSQFTGVLEGSLQVVVVPREKVVYAAELGAFSTRSGWNGEVGWEQGPRGLRTLEGFELEQLKAQSRIFFSTGLWNAPGTHIERLADEDLDGRAHYALELSHVDSGGITAYIDQETLLLSQAVRPVQIPGLGEVMAVADFWDYRPIQGVQLPSAVSLSIEGVFDSETVFETSTINGEVDPRQFEMPQ